MLSVILNGLLSKINNTLSLPLFFDSFFTVLIAALFGIIPGILTGLFSNLFYEVINGFPGYLYPFALVNMFTGAVTAVMVKKGQFESSPGVIWTILFLTVGNSILGAFLVTFLFDGLTDLVADDIVKAILYAGNSIFTSALFARILINFADKGIAVLSAYFLHRYLLRRDALSTL